MTARTVWDEETVRHQNGLVTYTGYLYNRRGELETLTYTTPDIYTYFLLNQESDEWIMRVYDIPSIDDELYRNKQNAIYADMKEFGVSFAWAKEGKITAVKFLDGGTPRPWDLNKEGLEPDFKHFIIKMSLKTSKYMSMFSQATYANGEFTIIFVDEDDHRYYPHHEGMLFVKITNLPEDEAYLQDGHFFIRPEVRDEMADNAYDRIFPHDPEKAFRVRKHLKKSSANNGRLLLGKGTLKGDTLVSHVLTVDVKADRVNLKPDIRTRDIHTGFFQMFPQEQMGEVFTNRQSVSSFYDSLMDVPTPGREDSRNVVYDAMADYVTNLVDRFRSGELMLHVDSLGREEQDQLRNNFQKLETWVNAGFSMNETVYLLMVEAGQIIDMHTPEDDEQDKKRRLPVPYASRHSIRNASTYKEVYGVELEMEFGEFFVDPDLGIIMSDDTYRVAAPVWGGADLDDHVEVHYRVAVGNHEFFGVQDGDIVGVTIRNPIGVVSNNQVIGTEYFVLKADAVERVNLFARFGELPSLDMASLPVCSAQVDLPDPLWVPNEPAPADAYSKNWLRSQINLRARAQGAYGMHVNLYLTARMYDIPFTFVAHEETIIDLFQQKPYEAGMLFWEENNEQMRQHLINSGIPMDYWIKKRAGLKKSPLVTEPGTITGIVEFHAQQITRFETEAKKHIHLVKQAMEARYAGVEITRFDGRLPILLSRVATQESRVRKELGLDQVGSRGGYITSLSHYQFEEIGNQLMKRLEELENDPASPQTAELTDSDFVEAHAWVSRNAKPSFKTSSVRSMYYDCDRLVMMGAMLDRLIKALS